MGDNYSHGFGENGLASPQIDTSGNVTIPTDGTYQFELKGGGGAAAFLDCAGGRCAFGGAGGHLIVNVPLKAGDVIQYSVAAGGVQSSHGHSTAYDGRNADVAIGAHGRNTTLKVNGETVAIAYGGRGAYRGCMQGEDQPWFEAFVKSQGDWDGTSKVKWPSDDPAVGGRGGSTWVASGKGISVVSSSKGANGGATVLSGLSNSAGQSGLTKQSWYQAASVYSKDQTPGYFLMSLNHTHTWESCDSACTTSGTRNRFCTVCRGIAYGTITVPAHGHNFKSLTLGDAKYKCQQGQEYYLSSSNSASNTATAKWGSKQGYYWSKECQYCHGLAEPVFAYKVEYDDGSGNRIKDPDWKYGGISYTPYTQKQTGWERPGYYIKYWYFKPNLGRYSVQDPDWPAGTNNIKAQYKDLITPDGVAVLVAKWEPIKYTLRIHENYTNASDRTKDFRVAYGSDFKLPYPALWSNNGSVIGYDLVKDVKVNPKWSNQDTLRNLTTERNKIIDIYTIWDLPPVVKSPTEIHFSKLKCASSLLNQDNGTISRSDLESELMSYVTATDHEWSSRYTGKILPGNHNGYSFGISSFEPATIVDESTGQDALVYYITFVCTDDYGQSAQSSTTLFVGDTNVDILVK